MPSLSEKFAKDPDMQLIFVHALTETKQPKKAENLIITLSQSFKTHAEISLLAAQTYMQRQEVENALLTINTFLNSTPRKPHNFIFYFLQSHIHAQLNQLPCALESIKKCLEMHPHFDKGWLLYASLYEKEGQIKEALSGYTTFLELSGGNSQIQKHLLSLTLKHQLLEKNKQNLLSSKVHIDNALILFKQQRYPQALAHINSCIKQDSTSIECKLLKINILSAMKNFDEIAYSLIAWNNQDPTNAIWPKTLSLLAYNAMSPTQIMTTFQTILDHQPHNLWCNLYCADICMRNKNNNQAIQCLKKALTCTIDTALAAKASYQLALLHYEQNDYTAMLSALEKAYEFNPQCPHTNNTLAYYWATKGKDLKKAQSFIEKSLALHNENPYFLDTQAVILYKEKKYSQAHIILEKLEPHNNGTMMLHLAKVHYALNNKENADIITKKAQALVKNNHEKKALEKMQLLLAQT
jgi:tetratricopeptide (TPR) repeat protein